ncbi:GNAT family N-acetyltransferase [Streptococcus parauberis]|uniref:GNAT family N-acetyltransferase n=1 Tax=Streptococcus parauberis TaxID=1348 RepID=UPI000CCDC11D|nr:GNAT family N-acetyltransferase [Streptococcus parauberis]PNY20009.1 hypothetical protein ASN86_00219 [Streptococcus parauberis]
MNNVELIKVDDSHKDLLWNILQKYLYELPPYYSKKMDNEGNFPYKYFNNYFENEPGREAFLFSSNLEIIGFALINSHSANEDRINHFLGEFSIFPQYRKSGLSKKSADTLFEIRKGKWQLVYSNKNIPAMKFWNKILVKYNPIKKEMEDSEVLVSFISE